MDAELATPLTEIELAELMNACRESLTQAGILRLRRLAFERNVLRDQVQSLEAALLPFAAGALEPSVYSDRVRAKEVLDGR